MTVLFPPVTPDSSDERQHRQQIATAVRALQKFSRSRLVSTGQSITLGALITVAHGLKAVPFGISLDLKCILLAGEGGWSQNDIAQNVSGAGVTYSDNQNVFVRLPSVSITLGRKDTGAAFTLTPANWNLIVKAIL